MQSYTITIAPHDDSGATTTLVVDTSDGDVRITDVHMRAVHGLSSNQMPSIDLGLLVQAVTPSTPAPAPITASAATAASAAPAVDLLTSPLSDDADRPAAPAPLEPLAAGDQDAVPAASAKSARAQGRRSSPGRDRAAAADRPAARERGRTKTRSAAGEAVATTARTNKDDSRGGRNYRRAPADLAAVYEQVGSPSAVAAHYEVPRHTAQGWIQRLRTTKQS